MVTKALIYLYFVLFPFGQLPGLLLQEQLKLGFRIHAIDIIAIFISILEIRFILKGGLVKTPKWIKAGVEFILFGVIAYLINLLITGENLSITVLSYAIRIGSYILFASAISRGIVSHKRLVKLLLVSMLAASFIGILQYAFLPDLRSLRAFGWDDHYYRLVGAFLDPAFIAILIALAILLALWSKRYLMSMFLLVPLALTYSRASWVALLCGLFVLSSRIRFRQKSVAIAALMLFSIPFLPQPGGEGVNLTRTNSIVQKIDNYKLSVELIKQSPLIGFGLNDICGAKLNTGYAYSNNSCSGLDNSFLFVTATTGFIGTILFYVFCKNVVISTDPKYKLLFYSIIIPIIFHSLFTNTLFYSWVMGWIAVIIGISRVKENMKPLS